MPLVAGSINSKIIASLNDGPGTTADVAAATGEKPKHVCARLKDLMRYGRVRRVPFVMPGQRSRWLWIIARNAP